MNENVIKSDAQSLLYEEAKIKNLLEEDLTIVLNLEKAISNFLNFIYFF